MVHKQSDYWTSDQGNKTLRLLAEWFSPVSMSDTAFAFYWFSDWLDCTDLFSCIAASLFNKLTYLPTQSVLIKLTDPIWHLSAKYSADQQIMWTTHSTGWLVRKHHPSKHSSHSSRRTRLVSKIDKLLVTVNSSVHLTPAAQNVMCTRRLYWQHHHTLICNSSSITHSSPSLHHPVWCIINNTSHITHHTHTHTHI